MRSLPAGDKDPSEPSDESRHRSSAGSKAPAAPQQQQAEQRDLTRPPRRAASYRAAAVLLQAQYAGEVGESTRKAHSPAAVAHLEPQGAVQNAAAEASTVRISCIMLHVARFCVATCKHGDKGGRSLRVELHTSAVDALPAGASACGCSPDMSDALMSDASVLSVVVLVALHAQAAQLAEVWQGLARAVQSGSVSVQQAQADLKFAQKAVATKEAPRCTAKVAQAIKAAREVVAKQQLKQRARS